MIIILLYKIFIILEINENNINRAIIIMSLLPNALIFSSILLRESFITFFVTLSSYYFIKWCKHGRVKNKFFSIIYIAIANIFHSVIIGILIGYILTYIFYNRKEKRFKISSRSFVLLIVFILLSLVIMNNKSIFLGKFTNVEDIDDIINTANSRRGGSQYLKSLEANTWWRMILYYPIYMVYFLSSPLPWDWRGFNDLITFFIDSVIYLYFLYIILKDFKRVSDGKYIIMSLILSLFITTFVFGIGIANAGTAMRQRQKVLPIFIILTL